MNTTTTQTVKCNRCGRALRSAKSIAAGYGPTCRAKVAKATADLTGADTYQAFRVTKAAELVELAAIVRTAPGTFQAVSSRGDVVYVVDQAAHACSCPAGEHGRACYHLAAADILAAA